MSKKTAMQELLGRIEQMFANSKTQEVESAMNDVINIITQEGLEKEKEQVILAWKEGWKQGANFSADPELYFTTNYLSDEEKS